MRHLCWQKFSMLSNFPLLLAEFGVHLAEFTVDPQGALAIRQLASVLLKQYVEAHWSVHSEKFRAPEPSEAVRNNTFARRSVLCHSVWAEYPDIITLAALMWIVGCMVWTNSEGHWLLVPNQDTQLHGSSWCSPFNGMWPFQWNVALSMECGPFSRMWPFQWNVALSMECGPFNGMQSQAV